MAWYSMQYLLHPRRRFTLVSHDQRTCPETKRKTGFLITEPKLRRAKFRAFPRSTFVTCLSLHGYGNKFHQSRVKTLNDTFQLSSSSYRIRVAMNLLGLSRESDSEPTSGASYLVKLHKYLSVNLARLAPSPKSSTPDASLLSQSYTLLTLGLDPKSAPLSRNVKVPLTLGFGNPSPPTKPPLSRPLLLRLPPDRLLYLLLRWQSLPQSLPHVGRTDVPIEPGVPVAARGVRADGREKRADGDVQSVRSWVGSMRSVSLGDMASAKVLPGMGWFRKAGLVNEG